MTAPNPGPQPLAGYLIRDYDHLIATLARSRQSQGIPMRELTRRSGVGIGTISEALRGWIDPAGSKLVALADALGYDLALIPRDSDTPSGPSISCQTAEDAPLVPRSSPDGSDAPQELSGRFCVYAPSYRSGGKTVLGVMHDGCPTKWWDEVEDFTLLADLVRRADAHTQECP